MKPKLTAQERQRLETAVTYARDAFKAIDAAHRDVRMLLDVADADDDAALEIEDRISDMLGGIISIDDTLELLEVKSA